MKNILFPFLALIALLALSSCNDEIISSSEFKEQPVVFCLLDKNDTIHYVKINRGFAGIGNALNHAQIEDSNVFQSVAGVVDEYVNNTLARSWPLRDTMLQNKSEDGIFFGPEQKVYYFSTGNDPLVGGATYKLNLNINEGKLIVKGETVLVDNFECTNFSQEQTQFRFAKPAGEYVSANVIFTQGISAFANVTLRVTFSEFRGTDKTFKSFDWILGESAPSSGNYSYTALGQGFFERIEQNATDDPSITRRNFESITIVGTAGESDFYNYVLVNKPSSSLAQSKPTFTNLSVTEGFDVVGLFSSRKTTEVFKPFINPVNANFRSLDLNSTRELCNGSITGHLQFCSQHSNDSQEASINCN
jgi:hypothetical protein